MQNIKQAVVLAWQGGWRGGEVLLGSGLQEAGHATSHGQRSLCAQPTALTRGRAGQPLALCIRGNVEEALPPLRTPQRSLPGQRSDT